MAYFCLGSHQIVIKVSDGGAVSFEAKGHLPNSFRLLIKFSS